MSPAVAWKLEGDYLEGCDCNVACQCVYGSPPDHGDCHVTMGWHVEKGHYGKTKLDGLNAAAMFHAPGHMFTGPKWNVALYLDARATPEQAEALGKIFGGQAGGAPAGLAQFIGAVKGVRNVPIHFEKKGRKRALQIPNAVELRLESVKGFDGKEATLHNVPGGAVPGVDPIVATSEKYAYHDHGYDIELSKKNGYYSRFTYSS